MSVCIISLSPTRVTNYFESWLLVTGLFIIYIFNLKFEEQEEAAGTSQPAVTAVILLAYSMVEFGIPA